MKCTNCRCVIPDSSEVCMYCGQKVYSGAETTIPVTYRYATEYRQNTNTIPVSYERTAPVRHAGSYPTVETQRYYADSALRYEVCSDYDRYETDHRYGNRYWGDSTGAVYEAYQPDRRSRQRNIPDLSLINSDGSIDRIKSLLLLLGLDLSFIIILLLIILALML